MTEDVPGGPSAADAHEGGPAAPPVWLRATIADALAIDIEAPLRDSDAADCRDLCDLYRSATPKEAAEERIFGMLAELTGLCLRSTDRTEPFAPMIAWADGRRSASLADFRPLADLLGSMVDRASNPALRARLADVCWMLNRKLGEMALVAVSAYVDTVKSIISGQAKHRFGADLAGPHHEDVKLLRRALLIGRSVGWHKNEVLDARDLVAQLREMAVKGGELVPILWICELDLGQKISDPAVVAAQLNGVLETVSSSSGIHTLVDLWKLAARAYGAAKLHGDKDRCSARAAEVLVRQAEAPATAPILAAHQLSAAIAQLHNVPGQRDRRTELRHKLIDVQSRVPEGLSKISAETDATKIHEYIESHLPQTCLLDMLLFFASLSASPDMSRLTADAQRVIREHPLSALFGAAHLDRQGKVVHRTAAAGFGDDANASAIHGQIAQAEAIRRQVVAKALEIARVAIIDTHHVDSETLLPLLQSSPAVPDELVFTFAHGFAKFFQGDMVSAAYVLTPLLESSLRYLLKERGFDVTIFDDATQTQKDRTISSLFEQMRSDLDRILTPAIAGDLERVFLSKPGPYFRHALSHGLLSDGDPFGADAMYGCWLLFRLCLIWLFPYAEDLRRDFAGHELCRAQ